MKFLRRITLLIFKKDYIISFLKLLQLLRKKGNKKEKDASRFQATLKKQATNLKLLPAIYQCVQDICKNIKDSSLFKRSFLTLHFLISKICI